MKETEIKNRLKTAVQHSVPNVLDSILSDLEEQKGSENNMDNRINNSINNKTSNSQIGDSKMNNTKVTNIERNSSNRSWVRSISALAAVFLFVLLGVGGFRIYGAIAVDSIISFDVNPSLEMKVNKDEKVLEVNPLNEEGKQVIGTMNFKNTDLEMAVNALIGSMMRNGYIDDVTNSILISVENKDQAKGTTLQKKLGEEVSSLLQASSINGAVLSQSLSGDANANLKALADENSITPGKAQVILQLMDTNGKYTFEELAKLSVHELNLLIDSKHLSLENASSAGKASDKAYIGAERAAEIALAHAKVDSSGVKGLEVELDFDDGKILYEVEFTAGGIEYDYEVDAVSGEILSHEQDKDDDDDDDYDDYDDDDDDVFDDDDDTTKTPDRTEKPAETRMSAAAARKAVIDRFGGIIQKIGYNYNERNSLYKGEARKDGYKVVFELNARTKEFKKWDEDRDNEWSKYSHALKDMITINEAANLVVGKAGHKDTFVQKIEFDWNDSKPMYEGEAFYKGMKYDFEIRAFGGGFYKWDADSGDDTWEEKYYNVK